MVQMSPMQPYDQMGETIEDYRLQSREFLDRSRRYLIDDDLHGYFYQRKRFLHADLIADSLDEVAALLDLLEPLTVR